MKFIGWIILSTTTFLNAQHINKINMKSFNQPQHNVSFKGKTQLEIQENIQSNSRDSEIEKKSVIAIIRNIITATETTTVNLAAPQQWLSALTFNHSAITYFFTIYNTYFITSYNYNMYEVCRYCQNGNDIILRVNQWDVKTGKFKHPFKYPKSFKNSFFGKTINVGCYNKYRYKYSETDVTVKVLGDILDFKSNLVTSEKWSWIKKGYINMLACDLRAINTVRYPYESPSYPYRFDGLHIISAKPSRIYKPFAFLHVYSSTFWILILSTVTVSGIFAWFLCKFEGKSRSISDCTWDFCVIILWDSIKVRNRPIRLSLQLGIFMLVVFVIVSAYLGQVTSMLTKKSYDYPPIETLAQLRNGSWKIILSTTIKKSSFYKIPNMLHRTEYFEGRARGWYQIVLDKAQGYVTLSERSEYVIGKHFTDVNGEHMFHISSEKLSLMYRSIAINKMDLAQKALDINIIRMWDHGILQYHIRHTNFKGGIKNRETARRENRPGKPPESDKIQLVHLVGSIIILVAGYSVAALCLFMEIFIIKIKIVLYMM